MSPLAAGAARYNPQVGRRPVQDATELNIQHLVRWAAITVTKDIPGYLKLHTEDDALVASPATQNAGAFAKVCTAFQQTTGWQLQRLPAPSKEPPQAIRWSMPIPVPDEGRQQLVLQLGRDSENAVPLEQVEPLAEAVGSLLVELQRTGMALWKREAELAVGIPVTINPDEPEHLASRLESVLKGGAEALGCQAAALYLLDDTTSHLKLRTCWGLPQQRLIDPPRPLRGAVSDLEALVGHAVALEETALLPHWKVPEDFPSALCVPVATQSTPLGTLWFFCNTVREFNDQQTHLAEIIAGRLVADLEREVLVAERLRGFQTGQTLQVVATCQHDLAPYVPPLIDGWQVAGRTVRAAPVGGDFFDWSILPDGRVGVAIGTAEGRPAEAALTATVVQTALRAHAVHRHNAHQMLQRLNETLWASSSGDRFASVWYAVIDPDEGTMQFASAGSIPVLIRSESEGKTRLLTEQRPLLGVNPDSHYPQKNTVLKTAQALVACSAGVFDSFGAQGNPLDPQRMANLIGIGNSSAEEQLDAVLKQLTGIPSCDQTLVVVRHLD